MPDFEWFRRAVSRAGMGIDRVRRSKNNVDSTAVSLPARFSSRKMRIGEGKATVVLFLEFVFRAVRIRIAPHLELANELVALLVVAQPQKSFLLVGPDDPADILIQPLLVLATLRIEDQLLG